MTLQELIIAVREVLDDRYVAVGDDSDLLFSDASITRHLNRGERRFCDLTGYLVKEQALVLTSGMSDYSLPTNTLRVLSVKYNDRVIYHTTMHSWVSSSYLSPAYDGYTGSIMSYRTDVGSAKSIRFIGKPQAGDTAIMRYHCYPVANMVADTDEPEIPAEWHQALIDYTSSKLLRGINADTGEAQMSNRFYQDFVDECRDAKARLFEAMTQSISFGFGG